MKIKFDITPTEFIIIKDILKKYLTKDCKAYVFGSRAKSSSLHGSDLDLALECKEKIEFKKLSKIKIDFEDSRLPYMVDVIDLKAVKGYFRDMIEKEMIEFPLGRLERVPELRFKEFSGEWEEKQIKNILKIGSGKDYKHLQNGDIPVYGTGGYMLSVNDFLYDGESICIGRKGTIDKPIFLNGKFWTVDTLFYTHSFQDSIPRFIYLIFQKINWKKYNEASGVPSLSKNTIEKIKIKLPKKPEQQKIASFLTTIDTKIEQLTKKVELQEQYKKGAMQKIFKQEIRFKNDDGSEFEEWEEKKLGEIFDNIGGTALEKYTDKNANYKFISIGNYSKTGKYIDNKQRIILNEKTKTKLLKKDNLVMVLNDKTANGDLIGSTILIDGDNYIYNQRSERLICQNNILPLYAWFVLNSNTFRKRIFSISQGGTQIYVNFPSVKKLTLNIPSLKEQTKIANFLSLLDKKIDSKKEQLAKTKEFKKGLLQRMFV